MFIDDPLGGALTILERKERDRRVFMFCRDNDIPVVWYLAGGYTCGPDGSIPVVLEIHRNTMLAAMELYRQGEL